MVANIMVKTNAFFKAAITLLVALSLASCDGDVRPLVEAVEANDIDLATIEIQPPASSLMPLFVSPGERLQFSILGRTFEGQSVTVSPNNRRWTSSNSNIASVSDNGLVVAHSNGTVSISARVAGAVSQQFNFEVSDALLQGIERIDGNNGGDVLNSCLPQNFTAIGNYGGSDLRALTGVVWSVNTASQMMGAEIFTSNTTPTGGISLVGRQPTGGNVGDVVLNATFPADDEIGQAAFSFERRFQVSDTLTDLTVAPERVDVEVGRTTRLVASATYSNQANPVTVTNGAEWLVVMGVNTVTVGTVGNSPGVVSGVTGGTATVRAVCGNEFDDAIVISANNSGSLSFNRNGTILLELSDRTFSGLRLSTGDTFSSSPDRDVTNEAQWSSSNTNVVTVDTDGSERGTLTLLSEGTATISAEFFDTVITIDVQVNN